MSGYEYQPYMTVGERRAKAQRAADGFAKRGERLSPVAAQGTKLTRTFWGRAWCDHMESFSDFATRLPKGKTYVRNGAVIDLQVLPGRITAKVMGTELYDVDCRVEKLPTDQWADLKRRCGGQIGSLVELLQGKLSTAVMGIVTNAKTGLFPGPREIRLGCTCPDFAHLCKHVAAALYGVGVRLDDEPELLFRLRGVDSAELIASAASDDAPADPGGTRKTLAADELADVFGLDLAAPSPPLGRPAAKRAAHRPAAMPPVGTPAKAKVKVKPATPRGSRPAR